LKQQEDKKKRREEIAKAKKEGRAYTETAVNDENVEAPLPEPDSESAKKVRRSKEGSYELTTLAL